MPAIRSIVILCTAFLGMLLVAVACETAPPVQEMSDARQAIAVAREAGAADLAAVELKAAEEFLQSAERKLNERNYPQARRDALHAKTKALSAIQLSESGKESGTD
jgi:hypothetical protein